MLARLLCPGYFCLPGYPQATALTLPPCLLPRLLCQATEHPVRRLLCPGYCTPCHLPACLFAGQATLPRLLHTLPPTVCWTRLLCPGYCTPCLPACLFAGLPGYCTPCLPVCLPVCCPGYSAQATAHPACLPACLLARLLCPGYCTPCHLPACLFAGQATLPRLLHTLPPACLPVCWPGYSAQATAHPATCLPACLLAAQATLPRLLHTLPPACLPVCWTRLLCPGY